MAKPTVFVFTTAYHPFIGGAEVAAEEIMRRLAEGYRFFIFTARMRRGLPRREIRPEGIIIRVGFGTRLDKFFLPVLGTLKALAMMPSLRPALFWAVMVTYASGIPYILNIIRFGRRVPVVLTLQEGDSETHIQKSRLGLIGLSWRLALSRTDFLSAISTYLRDLGVSYGYRGPAEVIPNGVDLPQFRRIGRERRPASGPVVITVSRLVPKNGVDILIRAVAQVVRRVPGVRCRIVGDGPERHNLEALAHELGIAGSVQFIGEVLPAAVPGELARADVFARPSRSEGMGNAFVEALAAGLPIIGTPVGGILDIIRNGETGLFCRVDDPADLAENIKRLISDPDLARRIAAKGRKMVEERFSWATIADNYARVFNARLAPRLLIATGIYPPDIGGPATYSALLHQELLRRGRIASVVTYGPAGISRRIPKGLRHLAYFLACFWRAWSSDLVFAQDPVSAGLPALLAAKLTGRVFAIRVAGDYAWEQAIQRFGVRDSIDDFQGRSYGFRTEFLRGVQRFVVNRACTVITPSEYFRTLVSRWLDHPERVRRVYNGVALDDIDCQRSGLRREPNLILSAGRLVPWKGFETLITLMPDLPAWQLIIAGDGPERGRLKSKIQNLGLGGRVRIVGALSQAELLSKLCRATAFVLNTSFESFSFQVVTAMAAGCPVISTTIGNLPEIITDGQEGMLIRPDDRQAIIAAVKKFSHDGPFRDRIVARARKKAETFSIQRTTDELLGIFGEIRQ